MKTALSFVVVVTTLAACAEQEPGAAPAVAFAADEDEAPGTGFDIRAPVLFGDIGGVVDFDAAADASYGYFDREWNTTYVTLNGTDAAMRTGMLILQLEGQDLRTQPAGRTAFSSLSLGGVSVTGCSSSADTYYDAPATEGAVTIVDGEAGRVITVECALPSADDPTVTTEAVGTFTLAP